VRGSTASKGSRGGSRTGRRRSAADRRTRRRRRLLGGGLIVVGLLAVVQFGLRPLGDAVEEIRLPLRHEDTIRQQAERWDIDPALIAAMIYEESKFRDQTSEAGARGVMQITPDTAAFIARLSKGHRFTQEDLAEPNLNIRYGTYYLNYLLDHYDGNETLAVAAYNAGETNVDKWVAAAGGEDGFDPDEDIPFKETRDYVRDVSEKREQYRENKGDELGL